MAVITVYPDAGSGATTVDGTVERNNFGSETFAAILAASASTFATNQGVIAVGASTTSNQFVQLIKYICTFDTTSIGSAASIAVAQLSLVPTNTFYHADLGAPLAHVVASTPTVDNNLGIADYHHLGSVDLGSAAWAAFNTSGSYVDVALNSSGIANINGNGISRFGLVDDWTLNGTFGGVWVSGAVSQIIFADADTAGTTQDPKLTVLYSTSTLQSLDFSSFPKLKLRR